MAADQRARLGGYSYTTLGVVAICFVTIVFDGYDLIVYGTIVPALLEYREWDLTAVETGFIGSLALIGILFGALIVGTITDIVGRRKIMLFCITWFSLAMGLCAISPSPELLGAFRFIAGLGLGGVIPTAIALTIEYAPPRRRSFTNALMFSGYSVGAILAPVYGGYVIAYIASQLGVEWNFYAFAVPALLGVLVVLLIPRSPAADHPSTASKTRRAAPTA